MPITCFVYLRRFRSDPQWQSFQGWTLILGIIIAVAVLLLTLASKQSSIGDLFVNWMGLIQRFIIVPFMLWVFLFGLQLYRRTRKTK
jgi:ABC-type lipoprotein release transport system permease subunit